MNFLSPLGILGVGAAALAILAGVFFWQWQSAREDVGKWKEAHRQVAAQSTKLTTQLALANAKIRATANDGAKSYGQCQDLARTDATRAFDKGVIFGRSTCGSPPSPAASR